MTPPTNAVRQPDPRPTFIAQYRPRRPGFNPAGVLPKEAEKIGEHFAFLKSLLSRGDLILAGPRLDGVFGIAIFHADSLEAAKTTIAGDPVVMADVFGADVWEMRVSLLAGQS